MWGLMSKLLMRLFSLRPQYRLAFFTFIDCPLERCEIACKLQPLAATFSKWNKISTCTIVLHWSQSRSQSHETIRKSLGISLSFGLEKQFPKSQSQSRSRKTKYQSLSLSLGLEKPNCKVSVSVSVPEILVSSTSGWYYAICIDTGQVM